MQPHGEGGGAGLTVVRCCHLLPAPQNRRGPGLALPLERRGHCGSQPSRCARLRGRKNLAWRRSRGRHRRQDNRNSVVAAQSLSLPRPGPQPSSERLSPLAGGGLPAATQGSHAGVLAPMSVLRLRSPPEGVSPMPAGQMERCKRGGSVVFCPGYEDASARPTQRPPLGTSHSAVRSLPRILCNQRLGQGAPERVSHPQGHVLLIPSRDTASARVVPRGTVPPDSAKGAPRRPVPVAFLSLLAPPPAASFCAPPPPLSRLQGAPRGAGVLAQGGRTQELRWVGACRPAAFCPLLGSRSGRAWARRGLPRGRGVLVLLLLPRPGQSRVLQVTRLFQEVFPDRPSQRDRAASFLSSRPQAQNRAALRSRPGRPPQYREGPGVPAPEDPALRPSLSRALIPSGAPGGC